MTVVQEQTPPPGGPWLQTSRGRAWIATSPETYPYDLHEIAHALAHLCRFVGHTQGPYSVLQHSVLVAEEVHELEGNDELTRWALLHDAGEHLLGDMPAPIKRMPELAGYRALYRRTEAAIAAHFGLAGCVDHPTIRHADLVLLATERRDVLSRSPYESYWGALPPPRVERIHLWTPESTRTRFFAAWLNAGGTIPELESTP